MYSYIPKLSNFLHAFKDSHIELHTSINFFVENGDFNEMYYRIRKGCVHYLPQINVFKWNDKSLW